MIIKDNIAKETLLKGINKASDVVKSTYGAKGNTVMVVDPLKLSFSITKDGVSVAKNVVLEDEFENYGCTFVKNAAIKTVDEAGDGTTNSCILTQALCNTANEYLKYNSDIHSFKNDLTDDLNTVIKYIKSKSLKVEKLEQVKQIATISSNNDENIGDMVKAIYSEIGFEGSISTIETDNDKTDYRVVDGYSLNNTGYCHNIFVNNFEKGIVEYDNPDIYIINNKINNFNTLVPILERTVNPLDEDFKPIVLICHDIDEAPLKLVLENVASGKIKNFCIVTSDLIHQDRKNKFLDTCAVIGSEYSEDNIDDLGTCERVIIEKDSITFINGSGDKEGYVKLLKKENKTKDLENRIFKLSNKAALIRVGGKLPQEIGETKDRIDDAVLAVKSAIEEGYNAGGATLYLFAVKDCKFKTKVMEKVLIEPFKQLLINANVEPFYYLSDIHKKGYGTGYDVKNNKVVNLFEKGIIDSSKVLRVSIENAVHTCLNFISINSILLP